MPFGVTASVTAGLVAAGVGEATAGILAAGLVSAGTGALLGGGIAALTGGNIGKGALMGGIGGALTGGGGALFANLAPETAGALGFGSSAADAAGAASNGLNGIGGTAATVGADGLPTTSAIDSLGSNIGANSSVLGASTGGGAAGNVGTALSQAITNPTNISAAAAPAASGSSGGILDWLGNQKVTDIAKIGNAGISIYDALNPKTVNPTDVANQARAAAGVGGAAPKFGINTTVTPYTGDWYTYGQVPKTGPMVTSQFQRYAHGGRVHNMATGGMPAGAPSPLAPPAAPPMMPQQMAGKPQANPLATHNGFAIGKALGEKLKATGKLNNLQNPQDAFKVGHAIGSKLANDNKPAFAGDGRVPGHGGGQDDVVHAKLSKDEFVIPADIVSQLGDGSSEHGGKVLEQFMHNVRAQKTKNRGKFPPKAKNPLSYLPKGALA